MPDNEEAVKKPRKPRKKKIEAEIEVETDDAAPVKGGALVIVESPTKAKTIGKYLGRGYTVKATVGHLRDLPKRELGVDVDNGFAPKYVTIKEKAKTLAEIKKAAKAADRVLLATDPDREGEAIAWHVASQLNGDGRNGKIRRVLFHEITKDAVAQALANPLEIDQRKVDAQQARRVLDRLVGYKASPVLWKSFKTVLSADEAALSSLRREYATLRRLAHPGIVRIVAEGGRLQYTQWPEMRAVLGLIDILKTDAVEAEFLTGEKDIHAAARKLQGYGPKEIVLTHKDGLLVLALVKFAVPPLIPVPTEALHLVIPGHAGAVVGGTVQPAPSPVAPVPGQPEAAPVAERHARPNVVLDGALVARLSSSTELPAGTRPATASPVLETPPLDEVPEAAVVEARPAGAAFPRRRFRGPKVF